MASFVSSKDLAAVRESKRAAREAKLREEEEKYLQREKIKDEHKRSGRDQWMLPGIERRIQAETQKMAEVVSEDSSRKHKKHKKDKKKKKKKRKGSESDSDEEWEEKESENQHTNKQEDWMNFDFTTDRTYTSASLKEEKDAEKAKEKDPDTVSGQHERELNPYWKDGGTGLPPEQGGAENPIKAAKVSKDWLLRSLKRMNEQAEEQGRPVEAIAAERYGSWAEFQSLLREAGGDTREGKRERHREREHISKRNRHFMRPPDDSPSKRDSRRGFMKPGEYDEPTSSTLGRKSGKKYARPSSGDEDDVVRQSSKRHDRSSHRPSWKKSSSNSETQRQKERSAADDRSKACPHVRPTTEVEEPKVTTSPAKTASPAPVQTPAQPPKLLSEKEKNQLAAKILKAELMGNNALARKLKQKLEQAREAEKTSKISDSKPSEESKAGSENEEETVVLTRTGTDGQVWPLHHSDMAYDSLPSKRRKKAKVGTHRDGERERYFADDDRHSLQDLVMRERTQEAEDQSSMMSRLASKQFMGTDSEYFTLDDMYVSEASRQMSRTEEEARQKQKAIAEHKKLSRRLENCRLCFGNPELSKHLLIAIGKKAYLSLPDHKPINDGHCFIVPMHHCNTGTSLDEDVWEECRKFMLSLKKMFTAKDMDCVFMQTCMGFKKSHHFFIDCIPMPQEIGEMSPIYFKKAIQECENEWSHNKKLVDTRKKDVRKCIPKGLPYFSVDFGMDGGFAHVIEDEASFPHYFGREVVGGMLDVEPRLWRHPPKDHFTEQTKRSLQFSEWWKPYDWTANVASHS